MGSKNRINLGYIMELVLHFHRNFYYSTKIYMSKRVQTKIKEKHRDVKSYTELYKQENFTLLKQNYIEIIEGAITD